MPKNPFRIVRQVPGFTETLARKPRLAVSVLKSIAVRKARARMGLPSLSALEYAATYACQATCGHCSAAGLTDHARERERLETWEVQSIAKEAFALGVYEVNITGGEPSLRKDLPDLVQCFAPERTFIGLNSNGDLLDFEAVRTLRDAGVDLLKLSLDSHIPEVHDAGRGLPGNHAHVVDLLDMTADLFGMRGHICTVGSSEAIRSGAAAALIKLAEDHDATIGFTLPVAVGRWGGQYEMMLPDEDLDALRGLCDHPRAFFQGSVGTASFACPAGRTEIYVTADGDVLPCPFIQRSFGNVRKKRLEPITQDILRAVERAGGGSLCLAGESLKWMKANVPEARDRVDLPSCATEHEGSFCRDPVSGDAVGAPTRSP